MKVLLVGNGAREHAVAKQLARDSELYAVMSHNNPGIARLCRDFWICDINDAGAVSRAIEGKEFDLGFSSPDATLFGGVSDALAKTGMAVASPSKAAARIEWDKAFMRQLVDKHRIKGSAKHEIVRDQTEALRAIRDYGEVAVKPIGLTGGKGVKVSGDHFQEVEDALRYAGSVIDKDGSVLIEEKLNGEEFTLQCFSDGSNVALMPPVQDHKRAYENDAGPNTGGMGSYSTGSNLPFLEQRDVEEGKEILEGVISAMNKEGTPFTGILYGQFMVSRDGPKIIEFNARFGDPEAMNVLSLLENSLSDIFLSMAEHKLRQPKFSSQSTVVKYLVPEGYPDKPLKDAAVSADEKAISDAGGELFYASVYAEAGHTYTTGSRAFGVLGKADTIEEAEQVAEKACSFVTGPLWHRKDIGTKPLIQRRIDHMQELRS